MKVEQMLEKCIYKNQIYLDGSSDWKNNYDSTVLNMKAVKEATGYAGAICNWLMEGASVLEMDIAMARSIGNKFQRAALDSKHNQGAARGFMELPWFKVVDLKTSTKKGTSALNIATSIGALLGNTTKEDIEEIEIYLMEIGVKLDTPTTTLKDIVENDMLGF